MMTTKSRAALAVLALYLVLYIVPLELRPLFIPDEARYAEIPREMLASGDWVVPRLNGVRYFEKPVLGYWLNALAIAALGENRFAVRLPSALAVGLTAALIFLLVRSWFRAPAQDALRAAIAAGDAAASDKAALLAVAAYLTCGLVFGVGTYAVLDSLFAGFVSAAVTAFFFAVQTSRVGPRLALLGLAGIAAGAAFLTKGPLGIVLPVLALGPYLAWERRWRDLLLWGWIPLLVAAAVAAPWAWQIHLREPDYWHQFIWVEHVQRFTQPGGSQHPQPFWFFVPVALVGLLPWSAVFLAVLLAALPIGQRPTLSSPQLRLAWCWFLFPFLFLSASRGKLATYILPCIPPLIVLGAAVVAHGLAAGRQRRIRNGMLAWVAIVAVAAVVVLALQVVGVDGEPLYRRHELWKLGLALACPAASCALAVAAARQPSPGRSLAWFAAAPVLMLVATHLAVPDHLRDSKAPGEFLAPIAARGRPADLLITDKTLCHAVCWVCRRSDAYIVGRPGELKYGMTRPDAGQRWLTPERLQDLVATAGPDRKVVLLLAAKRFSAQEQGLPLPDALLTEGDYVCAEFTGAVTARR